MKRSFVAAAALLFAFAASAAPKRLLVVTHTAGFRHSSIPVAERVIGELGARSGLFDVTYCRTAEEVAVLLTPAFLADVDGVFFANTTGDLGIPDLAGFLAWVKRGGAFFGAHSAADTYHPTCEGSGYVEMLGAEFRTHGNQAEVEARREDRAHPSAAPLPDTWRILDEIYEFAPDPRAGAHVVLSLDRHPADGHPEAGAPGDYPLAWYKRHGDGAVFYTALGHREDVWENAIFQQHLLGALRWGFSVTDRTALTVPAAASAPGRNGTLFRSDLWLFNTSRTAPVTVALRLRCGSAAGGTLAACATTGPRSVSIAPRATEVLEDVVGSFLGAPGAFGAIEISWPGGAAPVVATSRVSTARGDDGRQGSAVPVLRTASARTRSLFVGLTANGGDVSSGERVNAGVSNLHAEGAEVTFELMDEAGRPIGTPRTFTVAVGTTLQVDGVFSALGAGSTLTRGAALVVHSEVPVLAYVAIVDNRSGDSILLEPADDP